MMAPESARHRRNYVRADVVVERTGGYWLLVPQTEDARAFIQDVPGASWIGNAFEMDNQHVDDAIQSLEDHQFDVVGASAGHYLSNTKPGAACCGRVGCRDTRPRCGWRRRKVKAERDHACECGAYGFPHRYGSGRCVHGPEGSARLYEELEKPVRLRRNEGAYWVWTLRVGSDEPMASEGPWGPYDLQGGKTFARIGATEGKHDRVVTLGLGGRGFDVVRRYRAGTGERLI